MRWLFGKKPEIVEDDYVSAWKTSFNDCSTEEYLPDYSVCRCSDNVYCRYLTRYSGMILCSHPKHREFISLSVETTSA